jgi:hypothetical protein
MDEDVQQEVPPHDIIDLMDITMQRLVIQALGVPHGLRGAFLSTTSKNIEEQTTLRKLSRRRHV